MCDSMEFKSKLENIVAYILSDESQYFSENPDYMKRIEYIKNKLECAEKKLLAKITVTDWLSLDCIERQNKYDEFVFCYLADFQNELIRVYFEMGINCGHSLAIDLISNKNDYKEPMKEKREKN